VVQDDELSQAQAKVKQLLGILQQNCQHILSAEKRLSAIQRLERREEDLTHRHQLTSDELREVKERLVVIIKENKKLLEKNTRQHRELETLHKSSRRTEQELARSLEKGRELREENEIYAYRLSLHEKEIGDLKLMLETQAGHHPLTRFEQLTAKSIDTPMPVISEDKDELLFSVPIGSKKALDDPQAFPTADLSLVRQIAQLLEQRGGLLDQLSTQVSRLTEERLLERGIGVGQELTTMLRISGKCKAVLIRAGQQ
jgi:chromosome segregation ATPase